MALSLFDNDRWWPSLWGRSSLGESALDPFELMNPSIKSFAQTVGAKVDWLETDNAHIIKADLPGLKKEDVKVQLEDDRILHISGERSKEEVKTGDTWHKVERSSGKFQRRFRLPGDSKLDAVSAKVEDGVLTVTIPKAEEKKPESKTVEVA